MSVKHQPATPLPWYRVTADRNVQLTPNSSGDVVTAQIHGSISGIDAAQDVAYIAHACNAYPKLVEALRAAQRGDQWNGHLLGELGEDY
jgi:hypothetical protein